MSTLKRGEVVRFAGHRRPIGNEIKKDRPWVILSPDHMNNGEFTVIAAPLSRGSHPYPSRIACTFDGVAQHIILDQLTTAHYRRVRARLGSISPQALKSALAGLREMFDE